MSRRSMSAFTVQPYDNNNGVCSVDASLAMIKAQPLTEAAWSASDIVRSAIRQTAGKIDAIAHPNESPRLFKLSRRGGLLLVQGAFLSSLVPLPYPYLRSCLSLLSLPFPSLLFQDGFLILPPPPPPPHPVCPPVLVPFFPTLCSLLAFLLLPLPPSLNPDLLPSLAAPILPLDSDLINEQGLQIYDHRGRAYLTWAARDTGQSQIRRSCVHERSWRLSLRA